jgi:hypothetical protein
VQYLHNSAVSPPHKVGPVGAQIASFAQPQAKKQDEKVKWAPNKLSELEAATLLHGAAAEGKKCITASGSGEQE